jgi:S-adenosylmethionine hydrolase
MTRDQFDTIGRGRPFRIQFMRDEEITHLSTHYYNVGEGQKLCRFNATGFMEICINRGKAASLFGFKLHREKLFIYNTIKIYFG